MSELLKKLFISPDDLPEDGFGFFQVAFLGLIYGLVLFKASNLIADGSELLLLIPSLAGIVGSVVLPVLGAVPDSMMVLFSGLGSNPQKELIVGVGALAGSTIMLLTIPWGLAVIAGRVDISKDGKPNYAKPKDHKGDWKKLSTTKWNLFHTGVASGPEIRVNAAVMLATGAIYLIIQIPALKSTGTVARDESIDARKVAKEQNRFALVGLILAFIAFIGYLCWNIVSASHRRVVEELKEMLNIRAIKEKKLSFSAVMSGELQRIRDRSENVNESTPLTKVDRSRLTTILRPFFRRYDVNNNNTIEVEEVRSLLRDLGEDPSEQALQDWISNADLDKSGHIDFDEFVTATAGYLEAAAKDPAHRNSMFKDNKPVILPESINKVKAGDMEEDGDGDLEDEEEDIPEDLAHLPVDQQRKRILIRALSMMGAGTFLVLTFADPMVDILGELGNRTGISSFYISFLLAPLASNASEIIAAYSYAQKKTSKTITISFATLLGAACMNNTLGLGIFLSLVYFRNLVWEFSAETLAILLVEAALGYLAFKRVHRLIDGLVVMSLLVFSLLLVAILETFVGLD